jgi:type VI protein secretion system component VasF
MMAKRRHEMSEKKQDNEKAQTTKRKRMRIWLAAIIVVLTAIVLWLQLLALSMDIGRLVEETSLSRCPTEPANMR